MASRLVSFDKQVSDSIVQIRKLDSTRAFYVVNDRGHQRLRVVAVSTVDFSTFTVVEEVSDTFVFYSRIVPNMVWRHENDQLLWMTERSGSMQLVACDTAQSASVKQLTRGTSVVLNIHSVVNDTVFVRLCNVRPDQPTPLHCDFAMLSVSLSESNEMKIITRSFRGEHENLIVSKNAKFVAVQCSSESTMCLDLEVWCCSLFVAINCCPFVYIIDLSSCSSVFKFSRSEKLKPRLFRVEMFSHNDLHGVVMLPDACNEETKIVEHVYAGPHAAHVPRHYRNLGTWQEIAERGYAVVQVDAPGTANRDKAWHDACFQRVATCGLRERIDWIKAVAEKFGLKNTGFGVFGGSAGGQSALACLLAIDSPYAAAAADCGCHSNEHDKIWWNEQFMGRVGPHYAAQANHNHVDRLRDDDQALLLTVSLQDTNVDPLCTHLVVSALIKAEKFSFECLAVRDGCHGVGETEYMRKKRIKFFVDKL